MPFPAELLYLDDAQRKLYGALQLAQGWRAFFNAATLQVFFVCVRGCAAAPLPLFSNTQNNNHAPSLQK